MREIKFRIWDIEENKHFEPIYEAYKGNLLDLSISLSGGILRRTIEYCSEHESRFPNRYKIQQYTGLKDKNGVEIYESDLILYQGCKGEVYYCNDTCMFMAKFKTTHSSWSFDSMDDEITVIGNIHENPELLNQ